MYDRQEDIFNSIYWQLKSYGNEHDIPIQHLNSKSQNLRAKLRILHSAGQGLGTTRWNTMRSMRRNP